MVSVPLSHSSQDKPFVRELAAFLQQNNDITVALQQQESEKVSLNDPLDFGIETVEGEERFPNLGAT